MATERKNVTIRDTTPAGGQTRRFARLSVVIRTLIELAGVDAEESFNEALSRCARFYETRSFIDVFSRARPGCGLLGFWFSVRPLKQPLGRTGGREKRG